MKTERKCLEWVEEKYTLCDCLIMSESIGYQWTLPPAKSLSRVVILLLWRMIEILTLPIQFFISNNQNQKLQPTIPSWQTTACCSPWRHEQFHVSHVISLNYIHSEETDAIPIIVVCSPGWSVTFIFPGDSHCGQFLPLQNNKISESQDMLFISILTLHSLVYLCL